MSEASISKHDLNLCDILTSAKPIHTLREMLKCYLIGGFVPDGKIESAANTVADHINISDVNVVCDMLRMERFKKNDLLICLLSSLLGIISSDMIRNDHSLQYDIACKTVTLLTSSDKDIRPSDAHQFSLMLLLPLALIVNVMPAKLNDIVSDNSILDDLLNFATSLMSSLSSAKVTMEGQNIVIHIRDILIGCYSLCYWQVLTCRSSTKDISTSYKKFASSDVFKFTDRYLRYLFHFNDGQPMTEGSRIDTTSAKCIDNVCAVLGKIAKKFHKMPRKSMCAVTSEARHSTTNRRKQAATLRRVAMKRDQRSSSDSEKESEKDRKERELASDGSDSTVDMSDYVLGASDSDEVRPMQVKHRRNPSNASARSKEGSLGYF